MSKRLSILPAWLLLTTPALAQTMPPSSVMVFNGGVNVSNTYTYSNFAGSGNCLGAVCGFGSPIFAWDNSSNTTPAGYAVIRAMVGNNPQPDPAANNNVTAWFGAYNGNYRTTEWALNTSAGQCGAAESCTTGYSDGLIVNTEMDLYTSASFSVANRAFRPTSGTYQKNDLELYGAGPARLTSAVSVWATSPSGANWWYEGIALSRITDIGLHFAVNPIGGTDTGVAFGTAAIEDDSLSANTLSITNTHTNAINFYGATLTNGINFGGATVTYGLNFSGATMTTLIQAPNFSVTSAGQISFTGVLNQTPTTIANLGTCSSAIGAQRRTISNGVASPTYGSTVSATGSSYQGVICNGTNWVYE